MNSRVVSYPYRMEPEIREAAEKLASLEDRSLNWMLNHLLRPVVAAELAKREGVHENKG